MALIISKTSKNNNMKKPCSMIMGFAFLLAACNDFFESDLSKETVTLIAPADNTVTTTATVNFYWEKLDAARSYAVQVVKPDFGSITQIVADTNVSGTGFSIVLTPGTYQWRVRAQNGSSVTPYTTRTFTIDSTSDLSSQTIILYNPVNNYATNLSEMTFSCYGLYNAGQYRWALKTHAAGFGGSLVLPEQTSTDTAITVSGLTEGYYDWGMRAETNLSSTLYSIRSIYIDFTSPAAPTLDLPANGVTSTGPNFSLAWTHASDSGSPLYDSVYIYNDASFTSIKRIYKVSSGSTLTDTLANGTYYWRMKTLDKAGNASGFSASRWFKLM